MSLQSTPCHIKWQGTCSDSSAQVSTALHTESPENVRIVSTGQATKSSLPRDTCICPGHLKPASTASVTFGLISLGSDTALTGSSIDRMNVLREVADARVGEWARQGWTDVNVSLQDHQARYEARRLGVAVGIAEERGISRVG